jgi:hypothetical protein
MRKIIPISITVCLSLITLGLLAFRPYDPPSSHIFMDDFESYNTTYQLNKAYAAWSEGAGLDIQLENTRVDGIGHGMRIDALRPNPYDGQKTGSIYHSISLFARDWANAAGISFWVDNPVDDPLWLTFNFKEAYNEYWSVQHGAPFMLQNADGTYSQTDCLYGNLVIPSKFTGRVIIPISSFVVPDWNTARGDKILQLGNIESFAIGITLGEKYPRTFYIDTFEVLKPDTVPVGIKGSRVIQIPASGEHREKYSFIVPIATPGKNPAWHVISTINPKVTIDPEGMLSVPAGTREDTISVVAETTGTAGTTSVILPVKLVLESGAITAGPNEMKVEKSTLGLTQKSDYDRFAESFEKWAMINRPLFVILSVGLVVFVIYLLSTFQKKLK